MNPRPLVSVIIPTYNGSKYLAAALDSVVVQQDNELECVIIDDGSTDGTKEAVLEYQKQHPHHNIMFV